jgi:hypothetical protein
VSPMAVPHQYGDGPTLTDGPGRPGPAGAPRSDRRPAAGSAWRPRGPLHQPQGAQGNTGTQDS